MQDLSIIIGFEQGKMTNDNTTNGGRMRPIVILNAFTYPQKMKNQWSLH